MIIVLMTLMSGLLMGYYMGDYDKRNRKFKGEK